jgi:hypothetical protein
MAILLHGTTRWRAERILADGPDPNFQEPGDDQRAEAFWTSLQCGPFPEGTPQEYALGKAALFPDEGGPAILVLDVPDDLIALTDQVFYPLRWGVVAFEEGRGLEELLAAWPTISKQIQEVRS